METKEKTLLLQVILQDLRGNWSDPRPRAEKALSLAKELEMPVFVSSVERYIAGGEQHGDWDGRYFRTDVKNGGYNSMEVLHGLPLTFHDKSDDFKKEAEAILTYPEMRFEDYERNSLWPAN